MKKKSLLFIIGVLLVVPVTLVFSYQISSALGLGVLVFWWATLTWLARRLGIVQPCGRGSCTIEQREQNQSQN